MIEYIKEHPDKITEPLLQHIQLLLITLVISVAIAAVLTLVAMRSEKVTQAMNHVMAVIYSIPSLALFALLIPVT